MPAYRQRTVREKRGGNLAAVAAPRRSRNMWGTRPQVPSETELMPEEAVGLANNACATPNGRRRRADPPRHRFTVRAVVDPACAGADAGAILDGRHRGIPVVATLAEAVETPRFRFATASSAWQPTAAGLPRSCAGSCARPWSRDCR